jgi:hypothetical protein
MGAPDSVISQCGSESEFDLLALFDESVPMADELAEVSNVPWSEPDTWDVSGSWEIGEEFGIGPIGLVRGLLHSGDVAGMGEFDAPLGFVDELLGEFCGTGTGFDGNGNVVAEWGDDTKDGFGIVTDRLISEDFSMLVHDAHLDDFLMVVDPDKNW